MLEIRADDDAHDGGEPFDMVMLARRLESYGFRADTDVATIGMRDRRNVPGESPRTYLLCGTVTDARQIEALRTRSDVVDVWPDGEVAPFGGANDP